ncbi:30S ribosomal protein S11 chloroplastic [Bienertia sinuspersici]
MIKSSGLRRDVALWAIHTSDILLIVVRDVTPRPHNGCGPPKNDACSNKNLMNFNKCLYHGRFILSTYERASRYNRHCDVKRTTWRDRGNIGPGRVLAQDTILPHYVEIVDNTQHSQLDGTH